MMDPKVNNKIPKKPSKLKEFYYRKKDKFREFLKNSKEKIGYIKDMSIYSVLYGLTINYMLWAILDTPFIVYRSPGYGILMYFITTEFPKFWSTLRPARR